MPQIEKFEGNNVLDQRIEDGLRVLLLEITNPEWDACGFFAVARDCGYNPTEGFNEWDFHFFESLPGAK